MKFSYNWMREMVDGMDADPKELTRLITMKTAECEAFELFGEHFDAVCAARILSVTPIEGSHNKVAVVEAGRYGTRTVVCGAPNCRPGIVTAYVPSGASLKGRPITLRAIDGVESDGMLASGAEIGVNRDHEGILELDLDPGEPVCAPDAAIEVDNKSLTHRPDLWGHHGMAREVAAILAKPLRDPADLSLIPAGAPAVKLGIEDAALCPRYSALVFDNVTVKPSPAWLQYRLEVIGLNPINNIVDVTNYVMAELAQPMHAFDADRLAGDTIFVRRARDGESIALLDKETYSLTPQALVIADANGPIGLAGVMGGLDSSISDSTSKIVLESANFHPVNIRRTASRLKLRTDASMRFEKSQDPANTVRGLARAVELLRIVSPGIRVVGGLADAWNPAPPPPPIDLPLDWLDRKLGRPVAVDQVRDILAALQFGVTESKPGTLSVTVPSWRATKDISIKDDLAEEVGRMIGYSTIPPVPPLLPSVPPPPNPTRAYHHRVREMMAAQGFDEVYNYSFLSEEMVRRFGFDPESHVAVANPISSEQGLLRQSLVPGIWKNIQENAKHFESFRLFEIGQEIHKQPGGLPREIPRMAAAIHQRGDDPAFLYELKRAAECLLPGAEARPAAPRSYEHPARTVSIVWQGAVVGRLFEFHPRFIETGRAGILDIDLEIAGTLQPKDQRYRTIRRYPSSAFDLSVVTVRRELAGEIQKKLAALAGARLESIEFVRQYEGAPLPEGAKSLSYRLTIAAQDRTLSSEEVGAVRAAVIEGMRAQGYDLRL